MLTVFVLGVYKTYLCQLQQICDLIECRFVLFVGDIEHRQLTDDITQAFYAVHHVPFGKSIDNAVEGKDLNGLCYDAVELIVEQYQKEPGFKGVCVTFAEVNTLLMERINRKIDWLDTTNHKVFRDKMLSKHAVKSQGLRCPHFAAFDKTEARRSPLYYFSQLANEFGLPFILKPTALASSVGVKKIASEQEFLSAWDTLINGVHYDIETFISGEIYHCDMVIHKDEIRFHAIAKYINTPLEGAAGAFLGSVILSPSYPHWKALKQFSKDCLRALGMTSGVAHMEVFIDHNGEPVFLECASRAPGSLICDLYLHHFGVSLPDLYLRTMLSLHATTVETENVPGSALWAYLPTYRAGRFSQLNTPELEQGQSIDIRCTFLPGDHVSANANFMFPIGQIMIFDSDHNRLINNTIPKLKTHDFIQCD